MCCGYVCVSVICCYVCGCVGIGVWVCMWVGGICVGYVGVCVGMCVCVCRYVGMCVRAWVLVCVGVDVGVYECRDVIVWWCKCGCFGVLYDVCL